MRNERGYDFNVYIAVGVRTDIQFSYFTFLLHGVLLCVTVLTIRCDE
jgi:hypothetical protein